MASKTTKGSAAKNSAKRANAKPEQQRPGCTRCKGLRRRYVPVPADQPHTTSCKACGTCWAKKPRPLTLPQVKEAMICALANCEGDIAFFEQVLDDGDQAEKRHARRMLAVLNELVCCDVGGERLKDGLRVTFSDGNSYEFLVRKVASEQA